MPYKVIVFDFDGTLADSFHVFLDAMQVASTKHGIAQLPLDRLDTLRGMSSQEIMRHLGIPAWKLPGIGVTMRRLMTEGAERVRMFPGAAEMLAALRAAGLRTAIATSSSRISVRTVLGDEVLAHIDFLECGASLFGKHSKLGMIAKKAKVPPKEVLYVGDELRDADAADAVRMDFAGVAWGYTKPEALAARSVIAPFGSPGEVASYLTG